MRKRLRITEGGALVRFEGGVSMLLIPEESPKDAAGNRDSGAGCRSQMTNEMTTIHESLEARALITRALSVAAVAIVSVCVA